MLPPNNPASLAVWCGARNGRRVTNDQRLARREQPHDAMNLRRFQRFFQRERRQNRWESFGEHRFARPRRADQQNVVATGSRNLQRPLNRFLSLHVGKIRFVVFFTGCSSRVMTRPKVSREMVMKPNWNF